jgi:1,4-alpha-glucan branching enzyme
MAATTPLENEIDLLVGSRHGDPHRVLGIHPDGSHFVIRAFQPTAAVMHVAVNGHKVDMKRIHDAGVFAAEVDQQAESAYELVAETEAGEKWSYVDPYRFWPTLGDVDIHLFNEGRHRRLWQILGAHHRVHQDVAGTAFAVWAPNARSVRVAGDFNHWDGIAHPMRIMGGSGIWELFVPGVEPGARYKYQIVTADGRRVEKADPLAFQAEHPPATASVVSTSSYRWGDGAWVERRAQHDHHHNPMSVYEMHLGSWRRGEDDRVLTYRELALELADYVADMGFTHVEFLPVAEHPYTPSWGYQVSSYFAPTSRFGEPDDFRALVDALHQRGIGVIVDWVPAHFPRDEWALARFDGTALYEHEDPRQGAQPDWGTLVFNFGRHEVRNFLIANALYWLEEFHIDGLRVDAVASMLYLDYSRKEGEWVPNVFGGNENLDAVSFLKELNETVHASCPGVIMTAEESTAWPGVSRPTYLGGLGFGFKWNMGWMHDTLEYFSKDSVYRRYHHNELTFGLIYAFSENFVLPLSHDEVVHGKASLLAKMSGDRWQKAANLRSLYAWMWAHPGKQLLFMGGEIAQAEEWSEERGLDWHLLQYPEHEGMRRTVQALNRCYQNEPALWERDSTPDGFRWIDASDVDSNVLSFLRIAADGERTLACIANLSTVVREGYRVGLPRGGRWVEVLNTDATEFAGSGVGNAGAVVATDDSWHGLPHSALLTLPPLAVLWLRPE